MRSVTALDTPLVTVYAVKRTACGHFVGINLPTMRTRYSIFTLLLSCTVHAQVACDVLSPVELHANLQHTWAEPNAGSWSTPDMLLPANRVVGDLALALDASASDSLCCEPIANASAVDGKIALLYRGTCDYSLKAKYCQDAGAIAVVIINNVAGAPAEMGAGSLGQQVTIPVFQITDTDGADLREALEAGTIITMLLGNKNGFYAADLGLAKDGVLMPPSLAHPRLLAAAPGEYAVQLGAWVHNYGTSAMTGVTLNALVQHSGSPIFDDTCNPFDLAPGDSLFVTLADVPAAAYNGRYTLTYSVASADVDEHLPDNERTVAFEFGDVYALAPLDATTDIPLSTIGIQPATPSGEYESCVHFRDAHASRVAITGIDRYVSINAPATLQNELVFTRVYMWLDDFTGLSDPNFDIATLAEVHAEKHVLETTGNQVQQYLPFAEPVVLEDNVRYLFCTSAFNPGIFFGYNEDVHYGTNETVYDQPTTPNRNGTNWFVGFTGRPVASLGARMIDANTIGFEEHGIPQLAAYPNPGNGLFKLRTGDIGPALITITDAAGRVLRTERITGDQHTVDLRDGASGVYVLMIESGKGRAVARLVVE